MKGIVLNGQASTWANVLAGVSQRPILGQRFYFIYINDISDDLSSNFKLFADNTSHFSILRDKYLTVKDLNESFSMEYELQHWSS